MSVYCCFAKQYLSSSKLLFFIWSRTNMTVILTNSKTHSKNSNFLCNYEALFVCIAESFSILCITSVIFVDRFCISLLLAQYIQIDQNELTVADEDKHMHKHSIRVRHYWCWGVMQNCRRWKLNQWTAQYATQIVSVCSSPTINQSMHIQNTNQTDLHLYLYTSYSKLQIWCICRKLACTHTHTQADTSMVQAQTKLFLIIPFSRRWFWIRNFIYL